MTYDNQGFGTKAIHAGQEADKETGAVNVPIYQTSTYKQDGLGKHRGHEYARTSNPTRTALQECIAALEGGKHGLCYATGMAAIDAVCRLLQPGDEVVATSDLYGGTYRIFTKVYAKMGIKFHFVPMQSLEAAKALINEKTKLLWLETPTNPMLNLIDIAAFAALGKQVGAIVAVDNTFATPYLQQPLSLGADIVMHSLTKYMAGHSDVVMGALVVNDDSLHEQLKFVQNAVGATPGPQDCFLVLRGLKTLHVRMERHCSNAMEVAQWLKTHPKVAEVRYPGLPEHLGHEVAKKQMRNGFSGMISFILKGDDYEAAKRVMESVQLFTLGESLGGVESLLTHPAGMTHASLPVEERRKAGFSDSMMRLSVGIEDVKDLITDLDQALANA